MDDLLGEIHKREEVHERVLITTLTKKMAEDLTDFLTEAGVKSGTSILMSPQLKEPRSSEIFVPVCLMCLSASIFPRGP